MKTPFLVALLLSALSLHAQTDDLDLLQKDLGKAMREKRPADALALCDQILKRDVVADFVEYGTSPVYDVMSCLAKTGHLGTRIEEWKGELAAQPKSERLNYLLAMALADVNGTIGDGRRTMGIFAPVHLRLRREGSQFISEQWLPAGRWQVLQTVTISMPRKVLAGMAVSSGTAKMKKPTLVVAGSPLAEESWREAQIGRPRSRGKFESAGEELRFTGAGFPLQEKPNDDIYFVYREVEGDVVFEAVVDEVGAGNELVSAGIMLRSSLDPGAPFISLALWKDSLGIFHRSAQGEVAGYLTNLCASRPTDAAFVNACLGVMLRFWMNEAAREAADRLLASTANPRELDERLFGQIYWRSGEESPLLQAKLDRPVSQDPGERSERAGILLEQAMKFQNDGQDERAVETWNKARELLPGHRLPLIAHRQMIVSLSKMQRLDEVKRELKDLFLGGDVLGTGDASQALLDSLGIRSPCLAPPFMPAFHAAAEYGVALEIASQLEKSGGSSEQKGAARAVAATLRVAAQDPSMMARLKAEGGTPAKSTGALPARGLALLAFQLQQTPEGRAIAVNVLSRLLAGPDSGSREFDPKAVLAWRLRLNEMLGDQKAVARDLADLAVVLSREEKINDPVGAAVIGRLLEAGDISQAEKLAARLPKMSLPSPFDPSSDAATLLELYQSRGMPMPIIWTVPDGDEVRVHWEFAPDNWGYQPIREVRPRGTGIAAQNGKYSLAIYAQRGLHFSSDFPDEDLLVQIPAVDSEGSWKGRLPTDRSWVAAVLRDEGKGRKRSPSLPAKAGPNLLSPFHGGELRARSGSWTTPVKWYWTAPLPGAFPENAWLISRLQADQGSIAIDHAPVPVDPNGEYVFSGFVRTDRGPEARLGVLFLDASGKEVGQYSEPPTVAGRWTLVTAHFAPKNTGGTIRIPPNTASIQARMMISAQCEVGDIGLYKIGPSQK